MIDEAAIERGRRAKMALDEFVAPACDAVTAAWIDGMAHVAATEPWATDKIRAMALAVRYAKEARAQIETIIMTGEVAKADKANADKLAKIPTERRRLAGF
jgi:hypothetical protein